MQNRIRTTNGETDAEYLARIDQEILAGLRDLEAGNMIEETEYRADMDRFMSDLRERASKAGSPRR